MKKRHLLHAINAAMEDTPIIAIVGARQVGKTTLAKTFIPDQPSSRVSLDDKGLRDIADVDPKAFIESLETPALIDEIQRSPLLTSNLKLYVDEQRKPGAFIITGSADLRSLSAHKSAKDQKILGDSLAGRVEWLTLYTLTQAEINDQNSTFLEKITSNAFTQKAYSNHPFCDRKKLVEAITIGGYPEVISRREHRRGAWFKSYIDSIIRQDMLDVYAIEKSDEALKTLRLLAINSGNMLNKSAIYKHIGIAKETGNRFISTMSSAYLVHYLPSFSHNPTKALVAAPKIITMDSGLHCFLNEQQVHTLTRPSEMFGKVFENFVIAEIIKLNSYHATPGTLSHFRTRDGRVEVDLIYSTPHGHIGIEIKSGSTIQSSWKKSLSTLIADGILSHGYVIYTGDRLIKTSDNITYLPVGFLSI
jgi:predicted AAA+ superfamily ATPase